MSDDRIKLFLYNTTLARHLILQLVNLYLTISFWFGGPLLSDLKCALTDYSASHLAKIWIPLGRHPCVGKFVSLLGQWFSLGTPVSSTIHEQTTSVYMICVRIWLGHKTLSHNTGLQFDRISVPANSLCYMSDKLKVTP